MLKTFVLIHSQYYFLNILNCNDHVEYMHRSLSYVKVNRIWFILAEVRLAWEYSLESVGNNIFQTSFKNILMDALQIYICDIFIAVIVYFKTI